MGYVPPLSYVRKLDREAEEGRKAYLRKYGEPDPRPCSWWKYRAHLKKVREIDRKQEEMLRKHREESEKAMEEIHKKLEPVLRAADEAQASSDKLLRELENKRIAERNLERTRLMNEAAKKAEPQKPRYVPHPMMDHDEKMKEYERAKKIVRDYFAQKEGEA